MTSTVQLSRIVYSPLKEEESVKGWNKQTVKYALENKKTVIRIINFIARSMHKVLQSADIDDCYTEVLMYFYETADYDWVIAAERAQNDLGNGNTITLDNFVKVCIKFVTMRFVTNQINKEVKEGVNIVIHDDKGEELSLFDIISDDKDPGYDDITYDLESLCKYYESHRYKYNVDLFEIWFIKLLSIKYNKKDAYNDIMQILGVRRVDFRSIQKQMKDNNEMIDIARAISVCGVDQAISILRNYTYSANRIEQVVKIFNISE